MSPRHHLSEELLLAWSTGHACEATRLICATHLTFCPDCRRRVAELENIGGELLHSIEPAATLGEGLSALFGRIDRGEEEPEPAPSRDTSWVLPGNHALPRPIERYLSPDAQWESVIPGEVSAVTLSLKKGSQPVRLTRVRPGFSVPMHTHQGLELNLVLSGGFHDEDREFNRGDIAINDETVTHSLSIDPGEDCVILAVNDGPLRPVGLQDRVSKWLIGGF